MPSLSQSMEFRKISAARRVQRQIRNVFVRLGWKSRVCKQQLCKGVAVGGKQDCSPYCHGFIWRSSPDGGVDTPARAATGAFKALVSQRLCIYQHVYICAGVASVSVSQCVRGPYDCVSVAKFSAVRLPR